MSASLSFVCFFLICHQAVSLKQHLSSRSFTGQKIDFNVQMDDDVLEIESQKPDNAPDNFRETTSRYFFDWQLVAHKDKMSDRCYLQRTTLSKEDVKRRLYNVNDTSERKLDVEEEWINPAKAIPINKQMLRSMFGAEVADFCRYEQVLYLGDGSYGAHMPSTKPTGLRRTGLLSRGRRAKPHVHVIVIKSEDVIIIIVVVHN